VLNVPADYVVEVDEKLIPLEGLKAFKPVKEKPEADYLPSDGDAKNIIGSREVNFCYSGLIADKDGYARTSIKDPQNGLKITVLQNEGVVYAFSGDGTRHRPRKAIALEPVEYITNSYNRPELIDKLTVKPGASKTYKFAVEFEFTE
jgi:aldose 1-epimerase